MENHDQDISSQSTQSRPSQSGARPTLSELIKRVKELEQENERLRGLLISTWGSEYV